MNNNIVSVHVYVNVIFAKSLLSSYLQGHYLNSVLTWIIVFTSVGSELASFVCVGVCVCVCVWGCVCVCIARGGTQYKSGYRDVPQTWVAKSGRQVHQWVPFFSKIWYFDGSIFQNFLKFAPKCRKFGTLIGQLFKIFRNLRQNGANFSEKF